MPTVVQNLESATSGVQFVVGQIANAFSPQAKAISDFMLGKPALLASWADLLQKADDGNATWEDVIQPVLKLEALLSATAILAGTPGAQPAAMILGAVAGSMFIWQNRAAILGAEATIQSFFANRYAQLENSIRDEVGLSRIYEPPVIDFVVNDRFTSARNWTPPSDPLVLDLNGGGISTSGINPAAPLYFDHAGDGLPNATGWVGAGEGLVVRDLNGNGLIDSGRELFGDNTVLTSGPNVGKNATDGFAALRDLDSNADGKFDASDAAFSSVKIWKDQNQDGVSQSTALFSLAEQGVQAINLSATASNINLGGGNTQTFAGSFTRVGGGTGTAATADLVGNLLLSSNNFYRQFNDDPVCTPTCRRARRASVPTGLRARGRDACGTRLNLHQPRGLHANSVAAANWLRPTDTATRHAGGGVSCAREKRRAQDVEGCLLVAETWADIQAVKLALSALLRGFRTSCMQTIGDLFCDANHQSRAKA